MAAKGSIEEIERVQVDGLVSVLGHFMIFVLVHACDLSLRFSHHPLSVLHLCPFPSTHSGLSMIPPPHLPSRRLSQVALKIIKHCQEEGGSSELVTGFLVGLVVVKTLEITNCFPLSKDPDDTEDESKWETLWAREVHVCLDKQHRHFVIAGT